MERYYAVNRESQAYKECLILLDERQKIRNKQFEFSGRLGAIGLFYAGREFGGLVYEEKQDGKHLILVGQSKDGYHYKLNKRYKISKILNTEMSNLERFEDSTFNKIFDFKPDRVAENGRIYFAESISVGWNKKDFFVRIHSTLSYNDKDLIEITATELENFEYPKKNEQTFSRKIKEQ